ncbi:imelysin family protein [Leptospira dzoumogneensis]|uniref:Imelysin n=1 Tax=Leptospira dzoumogneensis TaxID=2484904 RepID=A0A4Z1ANE8_9LEPT|nr:imelysin family protein [Leptospira dzoumogneensis]TGM99598.1 imelysin [Leptospira dzoumogneensis]
MRSILSNSLFRKTLYFISALSLVSCGGGGKDPLLFLAAGPGSSAFLEHTGKFVIIPSLEQLTTDTAALEAAAITYTSSGNTTEPNLLALQTAWDQVRVSLKKVEPYYFGPAGNPTEYYTKMDGFIKSGARPSSNLVNQIITGVVPSVCTATNTTLNKTNLTACPPKYKGIESLEILLFDSDLSRTTIDSNPSINTANADSSAPGPRRRDYILALAQVINQDALDLYNKWLPTGGNFLNEYTTGTGIQFRSQGEAFDIYIQSLGNLVNQIQDNKLGNAACLSVSCSGAGKLQKPDPVFLEAIYSRVAYKDLRDNLLGIEFAYLGDPADPKISSMSKLVRAQNSSLDDDIQAEITNFKNMLNAKISATADLYAEIDADGTTMNGTSVTTYVKPIWDQAKILKNLMTIDAFSVLGVPNLPSSNDGD